MSDSPCNLFICNQEGLFADIVMSKRTRDYGLGAMKYFGLRGFKNVNSKSIPLISASSKIMLRQTKDQFMLGPDFELGVTFIRAGMSITKDLDDSFTNVKTGWSPDYRFEVWFGF